jgi:O-antigen/teichoic acid export membrane protein
MDRVGQQGIQALVSIVLARLLLPHELGLIGMVWVVIAVAHHVLNGGLAQALRQKRDANRIDESSAFYFNIATACVAATLIWLAAPWIGQFYGLPILTSLVRAVSLGLPIEAVAYVPVTLLSKELDLRTQAKAGCLAALLSGVVGIGMAYSGFGAWSLVAQSLSQHSVRTAVVWYLSPWRPAWVFRLSSLRAMFPVGSRVMGSNVVDAVFHGLYPVVIGRFFSAQQLGYYLVAGRIPGFMSASLSAIVSRVTLPVYPGLRDDPVRLREALRKTLTMLASINMPLMVGLCVTAEPLVRILLTDKWLPAVPYLRLHCLVMILSPLYVANVDVVLCSDKPRLWLRLKLAKKALTLLSMLVSYRWGVQGLMLGELAASLIAFVVATVGVSRSIGYPAAQQARDLLPYCLASLVMGSVAYLAGLLDPLHPFLQLSVAVLVGAASYLAIGATLRLGALLELRGLAMHAWVSMFGRRGAV